MRTNGTLSYKIAAAAGASLFNEDGEPIKASASWSDAIPCFIQTNTHNERGTYQDGNFTQAQYIVLAERGYVAKTDRVRLTRTNVDLGEYVVQDQQDVSVDRMRIMV